MNETPCYPFSPLAVVRRFFPDVTDEQANDLLWARTGWPAFWRTGNAERDIKHSLRTLRRTLDSGARACEFCNRPARSPYDATTCTACSRSLNRIARRNVHRIAGEVTT